MDWMLGSVIEEDYIARKFREMEESRKAAWMEAHALYPEEEVDVKVGQLMIQMGYGCAAGAIWRKRGNGSGTLGGGSGATGCGRACSLFASDDQGAVDQNQTV